jgi:hypothetical protein
MPARTGRQATKDVAAANDDGGLDAETLNLADVACDPRGDHGIDAKLLFAHEGFAGQFEQRAFVDRSDSGCGGFGRHRTAIISSSVGPSRGGVIVGQGWRSVEQLRHPEGAKEKEGKAER